MCEWLTPEQKLECNNFTHCCIYKAQEEKPYFDKEDHFLRSLANQPNHAKRKNNIRPSNDESSSRSRAGGN